MGDHVRTVFEHFQWKYLKRRRRKQNFYVKQETKYDEENKELSVYFIGLIQ